MKLQKARRLLGAILLVSAFVFEASGFAFCVRERRSRFRKAVKYLRRISEIERKGAAARGIGAAIPRLRDGILKFSY